MKNRDKNDIEESLDIMICNYEKVCGRKPGHIDLVVSAFESLKNHNLVFEENGNIYYKGIKVNVKE